MEFEDGLGFFPYGTQYHRAPTPLPEEWEGDLKEIARRGYTHVQFRPQWRWHERVRGERAWEDLDRLFDLAAAAGLRVILKPMLETAPDWVYSELDGSRVGFRGIPLKPFAHGAYYVGGWWPCFDNPGVVAAASEFTRALAGRYRAHPALWFYNAWNEPRSRPVGQCTCAHSVASYRRWLAARFGTVETLNAFLGKAWTSLETVLPPEAADDYAEMFLWRRWAGAAVASQARFVVAAIRAAHPEARIMMHVGSPLINQDAIWDVSDDFANAAEVDRYGTSFGVPMHPNHPLDDAVPDRTADWLRRVDDRWWCQEFYTNEHHWSIPPRPQSIARQVWQAIAGGAAGFTHWQWRSERVGCEVNGAGLREIDGGCTERSEACDGIAGVLKKHGAALAGARVPRSPIALLYSRESDMILRIQEMNDWTVGLEQEPYRLGSYKRAIHTTHAMFCHAGLAADWGVPGDALDGRRLVWVSGAEMVDAKAAEWLRAWARAGGTLVVEFPFACRDENTWVSVRRPNHGLEDLLGCREAERLVLGEGPFPAAFDSGEKVDPALWRVFLAPTTGRPFATWPDGRAAAVVNSYGRGKVISLGISLSLAMREKWADETLRAFRGVLGRAGIETPGEKPLWVRRRAGPAGEIWFVFNVHDTPGTVELPSAPAEVWVAGGASLRGATLTVPAGETWVARLPEE